MTPMNRRGGSPPRRDEETQQLPAPQIVQYFDQGRLKPALVDEEAEAWAKKFERINASQLRRFYESVLSLKRRLDLESEGGATRDAAFERLRAEFKMMRAKAAYTQGRAAGRDRAAFGDLLKFFTNHTASVKSARDFAAFCKHFEAVMAFHKFYAKEK